MPTKPLKRISPPDNPSEATAARRLCLSPLTLPRDAGAPILLAGPWCVTRRTVALLKEMGADYAVLKARVLSKDEYIREAELCFSLYNRYIRLLTRELNRLHGVTYSERYWNTLLNRFLYPLIATVMDKFFLLEGLADTAPELVAGVIDSQEPWLDAHIIPGLGASRLAHLLVFSIVAQKSGMISCRTVDSRDVRFALADIGDGKKDLKGKRRALSPMRRFRRYVKSRAGWLSTLRNALKGELPLWAFRYTSSPVLALGDQYLLPQALKELLTKAGGSPYHFSPKEWNAAAFRAPDPGLRARLDFGPDESPIDAALQECLRVMLPTIYLENFNLAREKARSLLPRKRAVILNSQHCGGRELVDFVIAHAVEEDNSDHIMICHGGCFGAMEVSVQDQIWAQISDEYALWSNPRSYGPDCEFLKMPSLRFHKWRGFSSTKAPGGNILMFLTGHYPNRYAYNSIFPYTIDDSYDDWQIRFLTALSEENRQALVIRDYHHSLDISQANVQAWAEKHCIRIDASQPIATALQGSRIAIQTVPQTTYLETLSADHPTLCYWNPEANMIRADLQPFYDGLIHSGVLHLTPESAAQKLNEIGGDVQAWWRSPGVTAAVAAFRENVCYTASDALDQWARFLRNKSS